MILKMDGTLYGFLVTTTTMHHANDDGAADLFIGGGCFRLRG